MLSFVGEHRNAHVIGDRLVIAIAKDDGMPDVMSVKNLVTVTHVGVIKDLRIGMIKLDLLDLDSLANDEIKKVVVDMSCITHHKSFDGRK